MYSCALAMLSLLSGCTMYQLRLGEFHLSGTVKAADTGKPIEGAQVRVVETTFIDAKRYKDLQEDIGHSGKEGRIDLDYNQKACRKAGPLRRMADALGREEPPGRLGVEVSSEGYDPLRIYTTFDELRRNTDGRYTVNLGDISLNRASAGVSEKNRREQPNCDK
jgi:hypothetical protein